MKLNYLFECGDITDGRVSLDDAKKASASLKLPRGVDVEKIRAGMQVELEHQRTPELDVVKNNPIILAKIALAHLEEDPNYYEKLKKVEES